MVIVFLDSFSTFQSVSSIHYHVATTFPLFLQSNQTYIGIASNKYLGFVHLTQKIFYYLKVIVMIKTTMKMRLKTTTTNKNI